MKDKQIFKKQISKEKILSCLIYKNNELVFTYYKNKKLETKNQTVNSVTKSVLSCLIGIAIDKGLIDNVNEPIMNYFSDYLNEDYDKRIEQVTIEHLLTMTAGFDWPEFGEWNFFAPMVYSKDIIKFILMRPFVNNPGEAMNYNSGCSHLLSFILQKVSNMTTHEFAVKHLFEPLQIKNTIWHSKQGVSLGADGLRIKSTDLAKIGLLYLNEGMYNKKRIISKSWIEKSTTNMFLTYKDIGYYGYHWWSSSFRVNDRIYNFHFALGYGGQNIIVVPNLNLVTIITSRMYTDSLKPLKLFIEIYLKYKILEENKCD